MKELPAAFGDLRCAIQVCLEFGLVYRRRWRILVLSSNTSYASPATGIFWTEMKVLRKCRSIGVAITTVMVPLLTMHMLNDVWCDTFVRYFLAMGGAGTYNLCVRTKSCDCLSQWKYSRFCWRRQRLSYVRGRGGADCSECISSWADGLKSGEQGWQGRIYEESSEVQSWGKVGLEDGEKSCRVDGCWQWWRWEDISAAKTGKISLKSSQSIKIVARNPWYYS